ncbi:uncharacterized protein METZ01_LOCUS460747, partial [marine metagenome]
MAERKGIRVLDSERLKPSTKQTKKIFSKSAVKSRKIAKEKDSVKRRKPIFGSGEQAKVGLDEESKKMRELTKSTKKWKSDADRIKKADKMHKLYGGWLDNKVPGKKKRKSSRYAPATGKQAVEEFYERVDRAKDRGEPAAKAWPRGKGHKEWRKDPINRHKGNK